MRIKLQWGGGSFSILLDMVSRWLFPYSSEEAAKEIHDRFGGRNYYCSRSGMSGAGWIPQSITRRLVFAYRVDIVYPESGWMADEVVPGFRMIAPLDYTRGVVPEDWPVAVFTGGGNAHWSDQAGRWVYTNLYLVSQRGLQRLLVGDEKGFEEREFKFRHLETPTVAEFTERTYRVRVEGRPGPLRYRAALTRLFARDFSFGPSNEERAQFDATSPFWSRLGLRQIAGRLYKVVSGICWARYERSDLATVESLQAASPQNVHFLTPTLYLQGRRDLEAVGLFQIDGEEVEFEERLEPAEAIRAMGGDFSGILARLEEGARTKHERALADRARQAEFAKTEAEREAHLRALCEKHGDLEVNFADSIAAGNCEVGTRDFRDRFFPGRETATVKDLVGFIGQPGVRRVLEHKLLPLA